MMAFVAELRSSRCFRLLATMVGLLVLGPFFKGDFGRLVQSALMTLVLLAMINVAATCRRDRVIGLCLALLGFAHAWRLATGNAYLERVAIVLWCLPFLFAAFLLLRYVFGRGEVTIDRIGGSLCLYFLFGLLFSGLHLLVHRSFEDEPLPQRAYHYGRLNDILNPEQAEETDDPELRSHLLYFSFVTLTTLGYGDTIPTQHAARVVCILESLTGVLYLAVMVARLVSLYRPGST